MCILCSAVHDVMRLLHQVLGMDLISGRSTVTIKNVKLSNPGCATESKFETFTLFFLGYDHSGGSLSAEEKHKARLTREGA